MTLSNAERQVVEEVAGNLATAATWLSGNRARQFAGDAVKLQAVLDGQAAEVAGVRSPEALNKVDETGTIKKDKSE